MALVINHIVVTLLVLLGNRIFTPLAERKCQQQMEYIQAGINAYNQSHPNDKKLQMEFGFPGFIEQTLIPQGYIKQPIVDIRETHSYYLERNGFVNCRIHQRNPASITILGIVILSVLATILEFAFLGYQIQYRTN
ncbi:MAG: hypothetical protein N3A72_02115 [bacterium]|nr:hypothetical protein [bacterium]